MRETRRLGDKAGPAEATKSRKAAREGDLKLGAWRTDVADANAAAMGFDDPGGLLPDPGRRPAIWW